MGIISKIKDGWGNNRHLRIEKDGGIHVAISSAPPEIESKNILPFRSYFLNSSASNEMNVNGLVTNQDFYIESSDDADIYIKTLFVEIEDDGASVNLNNFGGITPLTNGVQWIYDNKFEEAYTLHEGIKTNKEFIRLGIDTQGIGTGVDSFLADTSGVGATRAYFPIIDIQETYGFRYGLKIRKDSRDKLIFRIRDDLSTLTSFNIIAYGIRVKD